MKNLVFNVWFLLVAVLGHNVTISSILSDEQYKKEINKEFSISSSGLVSIDNTFGQINISPTDGDKVTIDVTISVKARNEDKAEEVFDRIDINFNNTQEEVSAKTEISKRQSSGWWKWLSSNNWNDEEFSINYDVKVPSTVMLDIENRHGDVSIGNMKNRLQLELAHGEGVVRDIDADVQISIAHGELRLGKVRNLKLDVQHAEFSCEEAKEVLADTKHSDINIDKADRVETDSGHDDYELGDIGKFFNKGGHDDFNINSVHSFIIDSQFTDYDIDKVAHGGEIETQHGSLTIRELIDLSEGLVLDGAHAEFRINTNQAFNLELESSFTDIKLPRDLAITRGSKTYDSISEYKNDQRSTNSLDFNAVCGGSNANRISARIQHGSLTIRDY